MNRREEQKRLQLRERLSVLRNVMGIVFFIVLLVFAVSAADMSIRRMIMCNDDKYALAVSLQEDNVLRLDLAGEKLLLDIEPAVRIAGDIAAGSRNCYEGLMERIRVMTGK